jgi:hypothetical protein
LHIFSPIEPQREGVVVHLHTRCLREQAVGEIEVLHEALNHLALHILAKIGLRMQLHNAVLSADQTFKDLVPPGAILPVPAAADALRPALAECFFSLLKLRHKQIPKGLNLLLPLFLRLVQMLCSNHIIVLLLLVVRFQSERVPGMDRKSALDLKIFTQHRY